MVAARLRTAASRTVGAPWTGTRWEGRPAWRRTTSRTTADSGVGRRSREWGRRRSVGGKSRMAAHPTCSLASRDHTVKVAVAAAEWSTHCRQSPGERPEFSRPT